MKSEDDTPASASIDLFNVVFEQDAMGMVLRDVDPKISRWLRVNQKFCYMLGYTREEMLQLSIDEITLPEEMHFVANFTEQIFSGDLSCYSRENRYLRKDGTTIWTNIWLSPVPDKDVKLFQVDSVVQDISERKSAEETLIKSEEALRSVIESIPEGFALYDADEKLQLVNENYFNGRPELKNFWKLGASFEEQTT